MTYRNPGSLTVALLSILVLFPGCGKNPEKVKKPAPPVPVSVTDVVSKAMPVEIRTFGTIEPYTSVALKSQITGILTNINFTEGQDVKKGDLLFAIDAVPMENDLKKAEAGLSRDRIQQANAQKEASRQEELLKKGLTSQDACDMARTTADALSATVKAEEAAVENARVQLGYCTIHAPMDGKTGTRLIDQGNLVKANETTLTTINQIKPIKSTFTAPEQNLGEIRKQMAAGKLEVKVFLPDEPGRQETGALTFVDNTVDRTSGTIGMKATFPNENGRLWPGQFVKLALVLSVQETATVVPSQAVQTGQLGTYVFVVKSDMSTESRPVKVARELDNFTVIEAGLQPGERVVIEGQQRIGPGAKVEIRNAPTNAPSAKP